MPLAILAEALVHLVALEFELIYVVHSIIHLTINNIKGFKRIIYKKIITRVRIAANKDMRE